MRTYHVTNSADSSRRSHFVTAYTLCEAMLKAEALLKVSRIVLKAELLEAKLPDFSTSDLYSDTMDGFTSLLAS